MTTARWRGASASGACATVAVVLHGLRHGLPAPPVHSWSDAVGWYEATGAPSAAAATLRLVAMAIAAWLSVAIGLQVLASLRPVGPLRHVADAISPARVRPLRRGMAGLSLSAGLALPATAVSVPIGPAAPAQVEPPPGAGSTSDGVAVMRPLPAPPSDTTTTTAAPPPPTAPTSEVAPSPAEPSVAPAEAYAVEVGESCWSIAADLLRDAHGQEPEDRLVWTVWTRLIELNRDRFVTGDPDVIFPGQHLLLPDLDS